MPPVDEFEIDILKPYVYVYRLAEEHPDFFMRAMQYESFNELLMNWELSGVVV